MAFWIAAAFFALSACVPRVIWTGRDPARRMRVEVLAEGKAQWLRTGDAHGERFDAVGTDGIVFSSDGATLAYPASRGGKWFMISAGKALGPYDSVAEPRFSPDGVRLAFIAQSSAGFHVVVDGLAGRAFERIQPGTLQFSRNSAHVAYVGSAKDCATVVVDDTQAECHERVVALRVSNEGIAAAVTRHLGKDRFVLEQPRIDPIAGPEFDEIPELGVSESGRTAYAARAGARSKVILDGVVSADCAHVRNLRFGDSGKRVGWVCVDKGLASVVIDGVAGRGFPSVSMLTLAARSPDFAYVARDERGAWVVAGESTLGPYSDAVDLVIAKSGQGFAFVARAKGVTRVMHGGRETPADAIVEGSLVLSEDGTHWAAITGDSATHAMWITVDGARRRQLVSSEVFGDAQFGPWLERELREGSP